MKPKTSPIARVIVIIVICFFAWLTVVYPNYGRVKVLLSGTETTGVVVRSSGGSAIKQEVYDVRVTQPVPEIVTTYRFGYFGPAVKVGQTVPVVVSNNSADAAYGTRADVVLWLIGNYVIFAVLGGIAWYALRKYYKQKAKPVSKKRN